MNKIRIISFIAQVKQEMIKVTWPSKKEIGASTLAVIIMVGLSAIFFLLVDLGSHALIKLCLNIGN